MPTLHDISTLCTALGTTSRALRYYEEQGLIESTVLPPSSRRRYTDEQVSRIKQVLALRALGLPVKTIRALADEHTTLEAAILAHRTDLIRAIVDRQSQINLLNDVLYSLRGGEAPDTPPSTVLCTDTQLAVAATCTAALLAGDYEAVVAHFGNDLRILLPAAALAHSVELTVSPLGPLLEVGDLTRDRENPNILLHPLRYEAMTVCLRYVFHGDRIHGFWAMYTA